MVTRSSTAVVSTSSVPVVTALPVGRQAHRQGVARLLASAAAIPADRPLRLAKRTSNLFRPRAAATSAGLDVSGLTGVIEIAIDEATGTATADVQGMCTYETLVATLLPYGWAPLVVPQLRTITLGGAVTGLGIESTSFRHGLPHESVLELDVLTAQGEIVTARPGGEHEDLFRTFPNSYGTLGYAVRLRIELERAAPYVRVTTHRFSDLAALVDAIGDVAASGRWQDAPVDYLDGVVFGPDEAYLVLGRGEHDLAPGDEERLADPTGAEPFYLTLRRGGDILLTLHDYLWRWDVDWFWCSKAFGAQQPLVRRLWPARLRRSDVYHRIVGLENRYQVVAKIDRALGRPARERVIQDVEVPLDTTEAFLTWFLREVPMTPIWLCPLRLRSAEPWPIYPLEPGTTYVNVGFWGTVPVPGHEGGDASAAGVVNRRIEAKVSELKGHKSLYSDAYYDADEFRRLYRLEAYEGVRDRYDPAHRLLDLYAKTVQRR